MGKKGGRHLHRSLTQEKEEFTDDMRKPFVGEGGPGKGYGQFT